METQETLAIGVILASVRSERRGEGFANWIDELIRGRATSQILDLRAWALPAYGEEHRDPAAAATARRWLEQLRGLDGFVIVTPEFNHGYPGALKIALDSAYSEWAHKPVAFLSYGFAAAGTRATQQLRQVVLELRMTPVPDEINLRLDSNKTDARGFPIDAMPAKRAERTVDELLWWAHLLKDARARRPR